MNNPAVEKLDDKKKYERDQYIIGRERNKEAGIKFAIDADPSLQDFYNKWDRFAITPASKENFNAFYSSLSADEKKLYDSKKNYYEIDFSNKGGLVMPLIIEWTYADGTKEIERISAYIWRKNEQKITKVFAKDKIVTAVKLDPYRETADIDENNNNWPRQYMPSKL